jgi:hypothetical protein
MAVCSENNTGPRQPRLLKYHCLVVIPFLHSEAFELQKVA